MRPSVRDAVLKVLAGLVAGLVIGIGVFERSVRYALAIGLLVGVGYAAVAAARNHIDSP